MDRINNITVNGVTYEVGGAGGPEQIYFIPDINGLDTFDSTTVKEALGNAEGCEKLYQAAKSGKIIAIKNDTYGGVLVLNVRFEAQAIFRMFWLVYLNSKLVFKSVLFTRLSETICSVAVFEKNLVLE